MAIIETSTSRSRFGSIPRVRGGGYVNAQDIASGSPGVGQLGDALQRAGSVGAGIATDMRNQQSDTKYRNARTQYMETYNQHKQSIFSTTGQAAFGARKQVEETQRTLSESAKQSLTDDPGAAELFDRWRMEYDAHERSLADVHVSQQTKAARITAIDGNLNDYLDEIVINPQDGARFAGNIQQAKQDIAEKLHGQPEHVIKQEQRKHALMAIEKRAEVLANDPKYGPAAALAFFDSGADVELGDDPVLLAKAGELRQKYVESATAKTSALSAMKDESTGMLENEARYKYYSDPNLTSEQAETKLEIFKSTRSASNAEVIATAAERKKTIENAYAESGFSITALPENLDLTSREREVLVKWGNTLRANGGKNPDPNINYVYWLNGLYKSDFGKFQEYMLDPNNQEKFYTGVGGSGSQHANHYINLAIGRKSEARPLTDTNAGWAAAKFAEDADLVLGSERDGKLIKDFSTRFETLAKDEARQKGLKNENDLSPEDRNKIYQKMRAKGIYETWPAVNTLTMGILGNKERTYSEVLADEEADFDRFVPYSDENPAPVPFTSVDPMDDDAFWAGGNGFSDETLGLRGPQYVAKDPLADLPDAVRNVVGYKSDVDVTPIPNADGTINYYKVTDGMRIIYLNENGKTVNKGEALAGQ